MSTHGELPGEVESGRHGSPSDSMQSVRSRSPNAKLAPLVTAPVMGLRGLQQFLNKSVSLLKGMDGTALGELAASLETRIFQDGDAIIAEGERCARRTTPFAVRGREHDPAPPRACVRARRGTALCVSVAHQSASAHGIVPACRCVRPVILQQHPSSTLPPKRTYHV